MLAPGGEVEAASNWSAFSMQSLKMYGEFVAELQEESGVEIDYQLCGAVEIARTAEEWERLQARAKSQRALGIASSAGDARAWKAVGALFYPDDAAVNPRDVVQALIRSCLRRGVEIRESERALRVTPAGVRTESGFHPSGAAVLSAGAWSGEVAVDSHATPATFPLRGHLVGADLPTGSLGSILRHGHTYLLQRKNGFTIAGSSTEHAGFDRTLDPEVVRDIDGRASSLLPSFAGAANKTAWLGFRPATGNLLPQIRKLEGCPVWLAYGHYRNGILLAPATAARIADEITSSSEMDWSSLPACR